MLLNAGSLIGTTAVTGVLGARLGGLVGLSLGWVVAVYVEAVFMSPAVYRATFPVHVPVWREVKQVLASRHNDKTLLENERV
jgi:hypothetical protein